MEVRMSKRIVICADGTWNRPEKDPRKDHPTNVQRIAQAIQPRAADGIAQQAFYDDGLGWYQTLGLAVSLEMVCKGAS